MSTGVTNFSYDSDLDYENDNKRSQLPNGPLGNNLSLKAPSNGDSHLKIVTKDSSAGTGNGMNIVAGVGSNANPSSDPGAGAGKGGKIFGFTLQQCSLLFLFATANILSGMCISLHAPFYPEVALEKGASHTENGIVFACFELVVFIMAPIFGTNMNRIGPKLVYNAGLILTAVCMASFGFLIHIDGRYGFIGLSIIIRIFGAVGSAAHVTASLTLIPVVFPDNASTVFAVMETCTGVGLIVGPVVGGALQQLGGFTIPFVVIGGLMLLCFILGYVTLMRLDLNANKKEEDPSQRKYGYRDILSIPVVALSGLSIVTAGMSIGYNAPVLERHIAQFNLTKVETGLAFTIIGGTYAITAPFWGRLCDKLKRPRFLTMLGAVFIMIGFIIQGPLFFIPFDTILWVTCFGLFIQGLGLGVHFVSGFALALKDSILYTASMTICLLNSANGLPDGVSTYGLVSGLWMSCFSFGSFIGPALSGVLEDSVGYRTGTLSVVLIQFIVFLIALVVMIRENRQRKAAAQGKDQDPEL